MDQTDALLESIKKELTSIIQETESEVNTTQTAEPKPTVKPVKKSPQHSNYLSKNTIAKSTGAVPKKTKQDKIGKTALIEAETAKTIDDDLQKMQLDLKQSYELFQTISDKFEKINFGHLRDHIKNLHLSAKASEIQKASTDNIKNIFDNNYLANRLDKLTSEMSNEFRKHPGEFGDIPELGAFFQTCNQLQNGLEKLKQQRTDINCLGKRMSMATQLSINRIEEIRSSVDQNTDEPDHFPDK